MNRALVGEPAVSAFLRSVRQSLAAHISSRMEPFNAFPIYYDPRNDLKKLKERLTPLQDLLIDGEARRFEEESVDEWMDDFKDLLYDVEDLLDDVKSLTKNQVRVHELYLISDEIKTRFGEIVDRTEVVRDRAKDLDLKRGSGHAVWGKTSSVTLRTRETSSMAEISEIHGREEDKDIIVKRLLQVDAKQKKNYDVVCIVGMGGLGKTTLAQMVFNDPKVAKHFDLKSWVCISNVFDVDRATKELIGYSGGGGSLGDQPSLAGLQRCLKEMVGKKRFLFVLDDVWSSNECDKMRVPFSSCANGSKILVTTRNIKIAHTLGNKNPYQLQELNHEKCIEIFRGRAFGGDDGEQEKEDLVEKIVRACGGVPLAVKVIGSMLQMAEVEKWRAVSENTATWANNDDVILPAIRISYYDLPSSLKRCFEYLSLFPPDYEFDQDDIVRLWIADGLVEEMEGRRVEDIGNEYYNELKARSLIQGNNMMHDIVHHLATILSRKFIYKENSKEPPASLRHAFLVEPNAMHFEFLAKAPGLRTLIVQKYRIADSIGIRSCKMLRAFKISVSKYCNPKGLTSLEENCIDHSTHIRYLSVYARKITVITHLQDSLHMLDNLQFLNLSDMGLENLPERINHLFNLRHLVFNSSSKSLPESICSLSQLQVLHLIFWSSLKVLPTNIGNLTNLRELQLNAGRSSISCLPDSICSLSQLEVLNLAGCANLEKLPNNMGNLTSLQKLYLQRTSISSLPESICALSRLEVLHLGESGCLKLEIPKDIGNLRNLRELDIITQGVIMPVSILDITGLEIFCFRKCETLVLHIGRLVRYDKYSTHVNIIIESPEMALMADLQSKKGWELELYGLSQPGDQERELKILEALKPHQALKSLVFSNYGCDKFPTWIMSSNVCLMNLVVLKMEGLNEICEMVDMEFVSLEHLRIENCPNLRKVLMATPYLIELTIINCGQLEADSLHLLPSLSYNADMLSIISQLTTLVCAYNFFECLFEKLKTANKRWPILRSISLNGEGRRVAFLPEGWPRMMRFLREMVICNIEAGRFRFLPDGDQSVFPSLLKNVCVNDCQIKGYLLHHSYTITSDGKVKYEEEAPEERVEFIHE